MATIICLSRNSNEPHAAISRFKATGALIYIEKEIERERGSNNDDRHVDRIWNFDRDLPQNWKLNKAQAKVPLNQR